MSLTNDQIASARSAAKAVLDQWPGQYYGADELPRVVVGQPMQVYTIGLNQLAEYKPGETDGQSLLVPSMLYVPISFRGRVLRFWHTLKWIVMLVPSEGGWKSAGVSRASKKFPGNPAHVVELHSEYYFGADYVDGRPNVFVVVLPALNEQFIGLTKKGKLLLVPTFTWPNSPWSWGEALPAEKVLAVLSERAKRLAEQYRNDPDASLLGG